MSVKQDVLKVINALPENVDLDEVMYKLYVLEKINQGKEAIKQGKKVTIDELKKEMETW